MLIAIDYDKTYTTDPDLWLEIIDVIKRRNHEVICVTMRYDYEIDDDVFIPGVMPFCKRLKTKVKVICTSRKAKATFLSKLGIKPDIWIDDNPIWLYTDAT